MISLSFVGQDGGLLSGINGQQLAESGTVRLRIVADIMGVASYDVTLTGPDGTSQAASVGYDPVAFVDQGAAADQLDFANLADGDYSLSVKAKDAGGNGISTQTGAFTVGEPFAPRVEAEDASLGTESDANTGTMAPSISDSSQDVTDDAQLTNASGASFVDFSGEDGGGFNVGGGEWVEWTVNAPEAGEYDIAFGYAFHSSGADNRPMRLDVNDNLFDRVFDFSDTGDNATYDEATTRVSLEKGDNTIRLTSNGFSGPHVDYLDVRPADPTTFVFQAEDLALTGGNAAIDAEALTDGSDTYRFGAENGAYLDWAFGSEAANATAPFTFDAPGAGTYAVRVTYAGNSDRPLDLALVDDDSTTTVGTFDFAQTDGLRKLPDDLDDLPDLDDGPGKVETASEGNLRKGWEGWTVEEQTVTLDAGGPTTLQLQTPSGLDTGPNIDKIEVVLQSLDPVAPSAVSLGNDSVLENAAGAAIGRVLVEDTDNSTHTITVSEDGGSSESTRFEVENGVLKLQNGVTLDHEAESSVELTITASDSDSVGSASTTETVLVGDVDEPATGLSLTAVAVQENTPGAVVAEISVTDPDTTYKATDVTLNGDADTFRVVKDGGLKLALAEGVELDAEAATQPSVTVGAGGQTASFTPSPMNDPSDDAPAGPFQTIYLQGESDAFCILDNADDNPDNDSLKRTQTQNQEKHGLNGHGVPDDTSTPDDDNPGAPDFDAYGLRPDYTGDGYLDINGSDGNKVAFDFDAPAGEYDLTLRVAASGDRPITVSVDDVQQGDQQTTNTGEFYQWETRVFPITVPGGEGPHTVTIAQVAASAAPNIDAAAISARGEPVSFAAPEITTTGFDVVENQTAVGDVTAEDLDGQNVTFIEAGGADAGKLSISPGGSLSFDAGPDFEAPGSDNGDNIYARLCPIMRHSKERAPFA